MQIETIISEAVRAAVREELAPLIRQMKVKREPEPGETCGIARACQILGFSKPTVYRYTSEGKLPHRKVGSRLIFEVEKLREWMAKTGRL